MKTIATILFLLLCLTTVAQEYQITGKVVKYDNVPIGVASVYLLYAQDSSWVKTELTNEDGVFVIKNVVPNKYILAISSLGYEESYISISVVGNMYDVKVALNSKSNQLKEVVVAERTDFIKTELGKTIVDVGKSEKTGITTLELLGKLPGVTVGPDGSISIDGKQGVVIMINDKPTYMDGEELVSYLRGLSAERVKQVEIMTQPSAKYDAEGDVGVINLEMNRNRAKGWSSSINGRYSQGVYPFSSLNSMVNYRKDMWHVYAQPGYWGGSSFLENRQTRKVYDKAFQNELTRIEEKIFLRETFHDYNIKLGVDYELSERTTAGAFVKGVYHPNDETDKSTSIINSGNEVIKNEAVNNNGFIRQHGYANFYLVHKFGNKSKIDFDADYFGTWKDGYQELDSRNYDEKGNLQSLPFLLDNKMPIISHVYNAKLDYSRVVGKNKVETGIKTSFVTIDDKNVFKNYNGSIWVYDSLRSNHFLYNESISAAYCNSSWELGKWQVQLGARGELSFINGHELLQEKTFSRKRFSVFPTVFVNHKVDSNNIVECNYGRRIKRPFYRELNPFTRYVSQYSYASGNPQLLPQYTHNFELKHYYKNKIITTIGFSNSKDVFTRVFTLDQQTNVSNYSTTNHAKQNTIDLSMFLRLPIIKEWVLICTGNGYYTSFEGVVGNETVKNNAWGYGVKLDSQFYFNRGWHASCSANFTGPSITLLGKTDSSLYTSASLSKKVFSDSGTLRLDVTDPFQMYSRDNTTTIQQTTSSKKLVFNTQSVALSFSYNIGKKNNKDRSSEMSEEMKRM